MTELIEWLEEWREKHEITSETLEGSELDLFVSELQTKFVEVITDFGPCAGYENAKLVLYTGVDSYDDVKAFCKNSQGEYYMRNQNQTDIAWNGRIRQTIAKVIGEPNPTYPITARVLEGKDYSMNPIGDRIGNTAT